MCKSKLLPIYPENNLRNYINVVLFFILTFYPISYIYSYDKIQYETLSKLISGNNHVSSNKKSELFSFDYAYSGLQVENDLNSATLLNTNISVDNEFDEDKNIKVGYSAFLHDNDFTSCYYLHDDRIVYSNPMGKILISPSNWDFKINSETFGKLTKPVLKSDSQQIAVELNLESILRKLKLDEKSEILLVGKLYELVVISNNSEHYVIKVNSPVDQMEYGTWISSLSVYKKNKDIYCVSNIQYKPTMFYNYYNSNHKIINHIPINDKFNKTIYVDRSPDDMNSYPESYSYGSKISINNEEDKQLYNFMSNVFIPRYNYPFFEMNLHVKDSLKLLHGNFYDLYMLTNAYHILSDSNNIDRFNFYDVKGLHKNPVLDKLGNEFMNKSSNDLNLIRDYIYNLVFLSEMRSTWPDSPSMRWKINCKCSDEILLNRFWKHCSMNLALEKRLQLHTRYAFIAAVADIGCPPMNYECHKLMKDITNDEVFAAILAARWKLPFESDHIEAAYQALQKTEVGEPAESALIETLIMMDEIKKINQERLEAWYLSQVIYANNNRRAILVSILTGIPSGREWIAERLKSSKDPASLKSVIRKIIMERVSATEELKRFDYMTQEECDKLKVACKE